MARSEVSVAEETPAWQKEKSKRHTPEQLKAFSAAIRQKVMEMWIVKKGPLAGAFSIVDLYAVFLLNVLDAEKYLRKDPRRARIAPKGTSAYALYVTAAYAGLLDPAPLVARDYRGYEPVPYGDMFGDVSIYKMGTHVDQSIGLALAGKMSGMDYPVVVFTSDGELQTGLDHQAKFAAKHGLNNLAIVVDANFVQSAYRISAVDPTFDEGAGDPLATLSGLWVSYGWDVIEVDGHDYVEIEAAMEPIAAGTKPLMILAKTTKGKGIPFMENSVDYSHRLESEDRQDEAVRTLSEDLRRYLAAGHSVDFADTFFRDHATADPPAPHFEIPALVAKDGRLLEATFKDWTDGFIDLNEGRVVTINTDNPKPWDKRTPVRSPTESSPHIFAGINERFALNLAAGLSRGGLVPFYVGPAAHMPVLAEDWKFLGLEGLPVTVVSLAPGSEQSSWGPAHLAYEDVHAFSSRGATVYQPATVYDLIALMEGIYISPFEQGPVYLRIPEMVALHAAGGLDAQEEIAAGIMRDGFYVIDSNVAAEEDKGFAVIIASGATMAEALEAARFLGKAGVSYKIINAVNLSRIDSAKLRDEVAASAVILTAIDAHPDSLSALVYRALDEGRDRIVGRGIGDGGRYSSPRDVYEHYGIDAGGIAEAVLEKMLHLGEVLDGPASEFRTLLGRVLCSLEDKFRLNRKSDLKLAAVPFLSGADERVDELSMEEWEEILKDNWYWAALSDEDKRFIIQNRIRPLARQLPLIRRQIERHVHAHLGPDIPVDIISYRVNGTAVYGRFQRDKPGDLDGVVVVKAKGIRDIVPVPKPLEVADGIIFDGFAIESVDNLSSNHPLSLETLTSTHGGGIPLIGLRAIEGRLSEHNRLLHARHNLIHDLATHR